MNLFIHRRDLRFEDNTTLLKSYKKYGNIVPIFIFDPRQIYPENNEYFSNNLVQFLCESLNELEKKYKRKGIKMQMFEGEPLQVLTDLAQKNNINSVSLNNDYSPFSKKRDSEIEKWCNKQNVEYNSYEDMLLQNIGSNKGLKLDGTPYMVFTPFMRNLKKNKVKEYSVVKLKRNSKKYELKSDFSIEDIGKYYQNNKQIHVNGGRENGLRILKNMANFSEYDKLRNNLNYSTTSLSAYINLGVISIREIYYSVLNTLGENSGLISELYWRDFYYNILYHFPKNIGSCQQEKYNKIKWENNKDFIELWKRGKTGFPMVDACMRQMNNTGYMHNRGRMIVSSFLTKDLLCDWQIGEKYFANQLVDYNMSANNGGWQWSAGTGTDSQPYYRIFNPWLQSKQFDPDCEYIKKWIPELENVKAKDIHNWDTQFKNYEIGYPEPIVKHSVQRDIAKDLYKSI